MSLAILLDLESYFGGPNEPRCGKRSDDEGLGPIEKSFLFSPEPPAMGAPEHSFALCCVVSGSWSRVTPWAVLFSEAEFAEYLVKKVVGGGFTDDFTDGVESDAKVHGDEFKGEIVLECLGSDHCRFFGA